MKICEIFKSLQGEGPNQGLPTIFLRLQGCNLTCKWCDTKYAQGDSDDSFECIPEEVANKIAEITAFPKRVCITGGEPGVQIQSLHILVDLLVDMGYDVSIETNGSFSNSYMPQCPLIIDYKLPSSGMQDSFDDSNFVDVGENDWLKMVIATKNDLNYIILNDIIGRAQVKYKNRIILSIIDKTHIEGSDNISLKELAEWVMNHGFDVRIQKQLHKLIWSDERGK